MTVSFCSLEGNYIDSLDDAKVATDLNPACIEAIVKGRSLCKFYANRYEDTSAHVRGKDVLPNRVQHRNNVGFCGMIEISGLGVFSSYSGYE